jgi:hypothetical protein
MRVRGIGTLNGGKSVLKEIRTEQFVWRVILSGATISNLP